MGPGGGTRGFRTNDKKNRMFLDIKELAVRKIRIRKSYAPGTVDYHTSGDFKQVEPLDVRAAAELIEGQIRITGELNTRLEMVCARCLEAVNEDVTREFDLFYRPLASMTKEEEDRLKELDDLPKLPFSRSQGLFL